MLFDVAQAVRTGRFLTTSLSRHELESLECRRLLAAHIAGNPASFATIQAAVDAAVARSVITVDAGVYPELVTINKPLTLRGAQFGVDGRSNARTLTSGESIVSGFNQDAAGVTSAFYIDANDVTLDGFTIQGNTSVGKYGAGVIIAPGRFGTQILDNVIQNNISGLFLSNASSTDPAIIRHNLFRSNNNPGSNGGRGIYTDGGVSGGNLINVTIDENAFISNFGTVGPTTGLESAIGLESRTAGSQSNIRITGNVFDNNGKALLAYDVDGVTITGNVVTYSKDYRSGALRFEGNSRNVLIHNNTLYGNPGAAIRIDEKAVALPNSNFTITANNIFGNGFRLAREGLVTTAGQFSGTLDAANNWWGDASGPSGDGPGTGDAVVSNGDAIQFAPWATAPTVDRQAPYYGVPADVGFIIQAEDYDHGGEGVAYHDVNPQNSGGQYRIAQGVEIYASSDTGGGYFVPTRVGEWVEYTVNVPAAGTYRLDARLSNSQTTAGGFHLEIDGTNVTGPVTAPPTGSADVWTTVSDAGITLPAGRHVLRLVSDVAGSAGVTANFNWLKFTPTSISPTPPAAPDHLIASAISPTTVSLTWHDNASNETGFVIERRAAGGAWSAIATTGANVTSYTDATASPATDYTYRVHATNGAGDSSNSNEAPVTTPAAAQPVFLSDLDWESATNGWGPVERDQSVGGSGINDGRALRLNGTTYAKGLGAHATSDVVYDLNGQYATFRSDVGIDDEETSDGSVVFQVFADGVKVFDSGVMRPSSATQSINVSVAGVQQLRLHVGDAGDGIDFDHADWAGARLEPAGAPVQNSTLIAANSTWKYLDDGSNQGAAWRGNSFNDSTWKSGAAELGYGDGDEQTIVSFGRDPRHKFITTYFRKSFSVADPAAIKALAFRLIRDDGAAVYLNGTEVFRNNLPGGSISSSTFASEALGGSDETAWLTGSIDPSLLRSGSNVIAVEIHQSDADSSDISFNFALSATLA
jgi:hypothetical protein